MKRTYLSCDRCGRMDDPQLLHGANAGIIVTEEMSIRIGQYRSNSGDWIRDGNKKGEGSIIMRDLCNLCLDEMYAQVSEIWTSTKPEALKLREVK